MKRVQTSCFVQLYDEKREKFSEITTLEPQCNFEMDVAYSSTEDQDIAVYLLENFSPVPFTVNGTEALVHYLPVEPREPNSELQFSGNNKIQLKNIKYTKNEYTFLFVGSDFLWGTRFQVNYPNGAEGAAPQGEQLEAFPGSWGGTGANVYASNEEKSQGGFEVRYRAVLEPEFFLYLDLTSCYGEPMFGDFGSKSLTLPITYAAVPVSFGKDGTITTGRVFYYQSSEPQFYVKLENTVAPNQEEFKMLVFAYPYGYKEDFKRTKRMTLWSYVMRSNYLKKEK